MPENYPVWTRHLPHNQIRSLRQDTAKFVVWEKCQTAPDQKKLRTRFFGCSGAPNGSQNTALTRVQMCSHDGAFDSPNACHDDFGNEVTSRGSSRVVFQTSSLAVCNFPDSAVLEIRCGLSSPGAWLCSSFTRSQRVSTDKPIASSVKRGHNDVQRETKRQRVKCHMRAHTVAGPNDIQQKVH